MPGSDRRLKKPSASDRRCARLAYASSADIAKACRYRALVLLVFVGWLPPLLALGPRFGAPGQSASTLPGAIAVRKRTRQVLVDHCDCAGSRFALTCPVQAVLELARRERDPTGPLFRRMRLMVFAHRPPDVRVSALVIKRLVSARGLDPALSSEAQSARGFLTVPPRGRAHNLSILARPVAPQIAQSAGVYVQDAERSIPIRNGFC